MNRFFLFLLLALSVAACSSVEGDKDFKRVELSEFYRDSGSNRYFLPSIPEWLNYSEGAQCRREKRFVYFDFEVLKRSQALSYEQSVKFQVLYNLSLEEKLEALKINSLGPKEEEGLFFEVLQKIQASIHPFKRPDYKRIHLIWVDSFLASPEREDELKKIMGREKMNEGQPLFVSLCLGRKSLESLLEKLGLYNVRSPVISAEFFSAFDSSSKNQMQFSLDFDKLFDSKQKLHLFLFGNSKPKEFVGSFELHP